MGASQSNSNRVVGERKALLVPNRPQESHANVDVEPRYPCTTILIHGVNDLGTDFGTVESGLCEGLNDRLNRKDFKGAEYTHGRMANDARKVTVADMMKNLDDVVYRRKETADTRSPLIPFYWGVRVEPKDLPQGQAKQTVNGQYVDKFGNRLDAHRAKNGGMFANATNNIPDMFNTHFKGGWKTKALDTLQGDPTHPLRESPNRHYMVLAAKRLAALVRQIRLIDPNETVNIVAHSQGTLISLLAQAFLMEKGGQADRPADSLILIDSPYSLSEEAMDQFTQRGDEQQTSYARAKTLANLAGLVAQKKHPAPALDTLKIDPTGRRDNYGITGPKWSSGAQAVRMTGPHDVQGNAQIVFAERDNRGKVYLYFCPEDATVGLMGVNGMGCSGLPDTIQVTKTAAKPETVKLLSEGLRQRIFTRRKRQGKPVLVGGHPGPFTMREDGESAHGTSWDDQFEKRTNIPVGLQRTINGEALPPPFAPEMEGNVLPGSETNSLSTGESLPGKQSIDQLEAEIALSVTDLRELPPQPMNWPGFELGKGAPSEADVERTLNQGKQPDDQCKVLRVMVFLPYTPGRIGIIRQETPNEAKVRLMNTHQSDSSYHSAVMSGRRNHRCATAFDVSIGQARALDDPDWAKLLRAIADWRIPLMKVKQSAGEGRYGQLDSATREIVEANCTYYKDGTFPAEKLVPKTPPTPVVSEILRTRTDHFIQQVRSNPLNNIPLP
ncbi:effector protein Tle3 domain-containing protein [Burkholderia ubonensis]|uniref:T6SS effector phospholipase Tle3 domain-containing protein n=1 Tax=Burkholderia ubonensis TaxID=101571 RepID=UPI0009B3E4EB|nr:DUF3274 domain-containing protein [Burkholderia ubonensis]